MTQLTAGFDLGTIGATIGTGDAGDANAWDAVTIGAGGTLTYDATKYVTNPRSAKIVSNSNSTRMDWTVGSLGALTDHYGRLYMYFTASPASPQIRFLTVFDGGDNNAAALSFFTGDVIRLQDSGLNVIATGTVAIPLNRWFRVEWHIVHSATVGSMEVRLYKDPSSLTPDETITATGANLATDGSRVRFGDNTGSALTWWMDEITAGATGWVGPAVAGLTAGFDTGTLAATVATGDTGDATAWDSVGVGANATATYDNAPVHGVPQSLKLVSTASGVTGWNVELIWQTAKFGALTEHYGRIYIYNSDNNFSGSNILLLNNAGGTGGAGSMVIGAAGGRTVRFGAGTISTDQLTLNAWNRIEWHVTHAGAASVAQLRLFLGANCEGTIPDEEITNAAEDLGSNCTEVQLRHPNDPSLTFWYDDIVAGAPYWPGPSILVGGPRRIVGPQQLTTTPAVVYTVPTGFKTRVRNIHAYNPGAGISNMTVSIGADAAGTRIYDAYPVLEDTLLRRRWFDYILDAGEVLQASADPPASFPLAPILDDFNRANANPLDGNWANAEGVSQPFKLLSNAVLCPTGGSDSMMYYTATAYGPDSEVYITIPTLPTGGNRFAIGCRWTNNSPTTGPPTDSTSNGYLLICDSAGTMSLRRYNAGSFLAGTGVTILSAPSTTISAGDKLGLRATGQGTVHLEVWVFHSGAWSMVSSFDDTSGLNPAGYLVLGVENNVCVMDDFGGGSINNVVLTINGDEMPYLDASETSA